LNGLIKNPDKKLEFKSELGRSIEEYLDEYRGYEDIEWCVATDFDAPDAILKKLLQK